MKTEYDLPFTAEQRRAIHHDGSPLCIIAGAGTGKTATLTARFARLVERDNLQIGDVLALTFTRKAADEMKARIIDQLDRSYSEFWVDTFHAFCQRILRIERGREALPAPRILEGQARRNLLEKAIENQEFPAYGARRSELLRQALVLIDRAKDELLCPSAVLDIANLRNDPQLQDLAVAYTLYQEALVFRDRDFDWGELQTRAISTLESDPATLQRWRDRFKHILVDEYQDINRAQFRLIELLAGDGRNLTVVGDVDQSIYAFRGASHEFLSGMSRRYPDVETVHLTRNFRSHQNILDVANALIDVNPHDRQQLVAHDGRIGDTPTIFEAHDEHQEAESIARQIARLHWIDEVPLQRIVVLLRSVQMGAGPIERALEAVGLRSNTASNMDSTDDACCDVLAVLRLIDRVNPGDLIRILTCQGIDPIQIVAAQIRASQEEIDLLAVLTELEPRVAAVSQRALEQIAGLSGRSLPEQAYEAAVLCGRLPLGEAITRDDYHYMRSLRRIIERAQVVAERGGTRTAFVEELEADNVLAQETSESSAVVQIMTVHAAKGLEFDHVFVAGLADGRFPLRRRLDRGLDLNQPESLRRHGTSSAASDAERKSAFLEEERRLGYVASTRACDHLYFSHAVTYSGSRHTSSTFTREIRAAGEHLLADAVAPDSDIVWNASELARVQHERIATALDAAEASGETLADLFLAQWTLSQIPNASPWRPQPSPTPYFGGESLRLSYSALDTYADCQRRYYYAHVHGLSDNRSSPYMARGTAVHDALQWMNEQRRDATFPSEAQLIDQFKEHWKSEGYESESQERQLRQQNESLLRRFHAYEREQEREILDVEVRFEAALGQHTLAGRIDCVARRPDGTIEVIDYKSGKEVVKKKRELQLGIYQIAYNQLHPDLIVSPVIYYLGHKSDRLGRYAPEFDAAKQIRFLEGDGESVDATLGSIIETAGKILSNEFKTASSAYTCRECAYRHVCEGANEDG